MAYDKSKGMVAIATDYNGEYIYTKLDSYMEVSSLSITPDMVQEEGSYRNANGELKRPGIMPYVASKIEWNIAHTSEDTMDEIMKILEKATKVKDAIADENKVRIRFYNPKTREYKRAWAYYPDIAYGVYTTSMGYPIYTATRIAFITYGEKR